LVENRDFSHPRVPNNPWDNGCEYFRAVFFATEPGGYATTWCKNIAKKLDPLSRVRQRYRRPTDRQQTTDGIAMTV